MGTKGQHATPRPPKPLYTVHETLLLIWILGAGAIASVTNLVNAIFEGLIAIVLKIKRLLECDVTSAIKLLRAFRRLGLLDADKTTLQTYEKRDKMQRLRILRHSAFVNFRSRVTEVGNKHTDGKVI